MDEATERAEKYLIDLRTEEETPVGWTWDITPEELDAYARAERVRVLRSAAYDHKAIAKACAEMNGEDDRATQTWLNSVVNLRTLANAEESK